MMDNEFLRPVYNTLASEEWAIIRTALNEFMDSDRWDEFDYLTARDLNHAWSSFEL